MKRTVAFLIKTILALALYGTPVLGVWLASSLIAYHNGITWLPVVAGVLLFPILPLLWEWRASSRRKRKESPKPRMLTFLDRLTLRTFFLSFLFIGALLAFYPKTAFLALSVRGDWMLQNTSSKPAELTRQTLFKIADGLEWLYLAMSPNPYETYIEEVQQQDENSISPQQSSPSTYAFTGWPWQDSTLHHAVSSMPQSVEVSIESVAQYLADQEPDPFLRIKALHDYVADRVAYDAESYFAGRYPDQSAATVFTTRKSVCAGYANLFKALGDAIGEEIHIITGHTRSSLSGELGGEGHAWNAVKIQDNWYLVDATWDSGSVDRKTGFTKSYRTAYLLAPPAIIGTTHFPEDPNWQLLAQPLSRGEFLRRPMMNPLFYAEEMSLVSPTRSQTDVNKQATIDIKNPNERWMLAQYVPKGTEPSDSDNNSCSVTHGRLTSIECTFPDMATYDVYLFSAPQQYNTPYSFVGRLEFNNRG